MNAYPITKIEPPHSLIRHKNGTKNVKEDIQYNPDPLSQAENFVNCADFRRKRNNYARCDFFSFSQFSPIEIIVFNKIFLYPIKDIDFMSSNKKDVVPIIFC